MWLLGMKALGVRIKYFPDNFIEGRRLKLDDFFYFTFEKN